MPIAGQVLVLAAGAYAMLAAVLALSQGRLIYPGAHGNGPWAGEGAPGLTAIAVGTEDGEILRGYWRAPAAGCGVVVSFHGNKSRPEPLAARFAAGPWQVRGWGVLALAYRGYPGSTGRPSEDGLIRDGAAAIREAAARAPGAPLLLHGHSLGAAVAVAVAERTTPLGLYLEAPFDSLSRLVHLRFPYLPTGLLLRDTYRSDLRIRVGRSPVLIVQGEGDTVVPPKLAWSLAAAAGPRARLDVVPGDHMSILGVRDEAAAALFGDRLGTACARAPQPSDG